MMSPEETKIFMDRILADIEKEREEYYTESGNIVHMDDGSRYIVSYIVLQKELSAQLDGGKVWGLHSLISLGCGINYSHPVPSMGGGSVDIRELMNVGKYPIVSVTFVRKVVLKHSTYREYVAVHERDGKIKVKVFSK